MDTLSPPQQETFNECVAITDISCDENILPKAIALLERHDFDLNNSVLAFFDRGIEGPPEEEHGLFPEPEDGLLSSSAERFESSAVHRNLQKDFVMNDLFPKLMKASRIPNRWVGDLRIYRARKEPSEKGDAQAPAPRKPSVWWMLLLVFPKTLTLILTALRYLLGLNSITYEKTPAKFDYSKYLTLYSILHDINDPNTLSRYDVATENFNESHEHCQKDYSFLVAMLMDDRSADFAHMLLKNLTFKAMFDKFTGEFKECRLFLANVDRSPEALEVAQVYRHRRIPYIFVAANVSRDPAIMSSMSLIYKANCSFGDDEDKQLLVSKLSKAIKKSCSEFNPQLVSKRYDKQEMESSRLIKEKQDEAYLQSLSQDRIKKQEKELQRQSEALRAELARRKLAYLNYLLQSEYFAKQAAAATPVNSVRVALKLPDGKRIVQEFLKSTTLCELHLFAELQMLETELDEAPMEIDHDDYVKNFSFLFEMFKPLPKCVLPITSQSIEEFGELKSGDTLLIEYAHEVAQD